MIRMRTIISSIIVLSAPVMLLVSADESMAQDHPPGVGLINVWDTNNSVHKRGRILVLRTKPAEAAEDREYGIVFMLTRGAAGRRGNALVCPTAEKIANGLRCEKMIEGADGSEIKEQFTVKAGDVAFCNAIGQGTSDEACRSEGFRQCVCYEIKYLCDLNDDGDYTEACPSRDGGAAADAIGPPPAGSGRGGKGGG